MLKWLTNFLNPPRPVQVEQFTDPHLGLLRLNEDCDSWEAKIELADRKITFRIGGETEPDLGLISRARQIVESQNEFTQMVENYLERRATELPGAADEIRQLKIEDICLLSPKWPNSAMIFFKGPSEYRLWHCDYVDGRIFGLAFDS
jgi:hypothetical protein